MRSFALLLVGLFMIHALIAQEKKAAPRIEKSAPMEMKNPDGDHAPEIHAAPVMVKGDFDIPPAPPACADQADQARLDCMSQQVLDAIRSKMDASANSNDPHSHPVVITFVINQFGDMKDIRVDHTGSSELPKKVNVALYAMPKFVPATKAGAAIGSSVAITYPYAALFAKE